MLTVKRNAVTVLLLAATVTFAVCMITDPGGIASALSNVATFAACVVAATACLVRAYRRPGRSRWAWLGIGFGTIAYAVGEGTWAWVETVRGSQVPFPSSAEAGYRSMVPLMAAGLLMVPVDRQSTANRFRTIVDGLIIATSLLLVSWLFVLSPLISAGGDTPFGLWVLLAYPVSDVVLVTVVFYMLAQLRRGRQDTGAFLLIGAAAVLVAASDSLYTFLSLHSEYASGSLLDIGWFAAFVLITLAALRPERDVAAVVDLREDRQPLAILLPYAAVVVALLFSVVFHVQGNGLDAFSNWCRSLMILLIVARQLLTLLENRQLTSHLESRVAQRSAELYDREQRFRALVQQSSDSVAVIEADSTIRYQTDSVERIFGWRGSWLVGKRLTEITGDAGLQIERAIETVLAEPYATTVVEVRLPHRDGRVRLAEMTLTNLSDDPSVGGIVLNTRDIHDAKELQEQLVHEAYHDGLTGLSSRALFRERLHTALLGDGDVAILFQDLDGFKEVNDSLGHAAGDQLLVQVADRLRESVREGDLVARFGGDEFAVLIESDTAMCDAETLARRIIGAVDEPFAVGGREMHVGASVGIASACDAGDIQQLMRNADLAMYKAKAAGGSGLATYDPAMHDQLVDRLELEADLRLALERDELALHYQPTVDLRTGEIVGFEALVRWHHPTRGLVSPLDFIGIAEATGLIVPLGRWVIAEACRQAVAWGAGSTRTLKMAVNVSVRQFDHCDLSETVAEVLAETGMPVDQLCLEMTESVLLSDTDENLTQLLRLKELGVTLAMDDFGTGYSSLAYLRRFPLDVLKIDRSFVDRLGGDTEDVALVRTIVRLGRSLGMLTVAEGIEDAVQLTALQEMGCDLAQGYHLSRPLPAEQAGEALEQGLPIRATVAA